MRDTYYYGPDPILFGLPYAFYGDPNSEPVDLSPLWFMFRDAVSSLCKVLCSAVKFAATFMSQVVLPVLKSIVTQCLKMLASVVSTFLSAMQKGLLFRGAVYVAAVAEPKQTSNKISSIFVGKLTKLDELQPAVPHGFNHNCLL